MRAMICDACKKIYKPYYKCADGRFGEGNALTIVKIEKDGSMKRRKKLELCPTCMADVFDYIETSLISEDTENPVIFSEDYAKDEEKGVSDGE